MDGLQAAAGGPGRGMACCGGHLRPRCFSRLALASSLVQLEAGRRDRGDLAAVWLAEDVVADGVLRQ